MHGLIFETSIWLLAGSTRFLIFKTHPGIAANQFWFSNKELLEKKTLSESGKTQNSISATPTQFSQQTTYYCWPVTKPLSLTKPTMSHCNLTITHTTMRLQEFIKRTNTTSHYLATPSWNRCKSAVAVLMIAKRSHASKRGKRSKTPHNRYFSIAKQKTISFETHQFHCFLFASRIVWAPTSVILTPFPRFHPPSEKAKVESGTPPASPTHRPLPTQATK